MKSSLFDPVDLYFKSEIEIEIEISIKIDNSPYF